MTRTFIPKALVVSLALTAMLWTGMDRAEEFQTLGEISAEALSSDELASVEGKFVILPGVLSLGGPDTRGLNLNNLLNLGALLQRDVPNLGHLLNGVIPLQPNPVPCPLCLL